MEFLLNTAWWSLAVLVLQAQALPHHLQFTGFDGTRFEFPAFGGGIFNMLTEEEHQINAHFADLAKAGVPVLQTLVFRYKDEVEVAMASNAKPTDTSAHSSVLINEKLLDTSRMDGKYTRKLSKQVAMEYSQNTDGDEYLLVHTPKMLLYITKYVDSMNLDFTIDIVAKMDKVHGVIGQTYHWAKAGNGVRKFVEGDETSYLLPNIASNKFKFNLFRYNT